MEDFLPFIIIVLLFLFSNFFLKKNFKLRILFLSIAVVILLASVFFGDENDKYKALIFSLFGIFIIYRLLTTKKEK